MSKGRSKHQINGHGLFKMLLRKNMGGGGVLVLNLAAVPYYSVFKQYAKIKGKKDNKKAQLSLNYFISVFDT